MTEARNKWEYISRGQKNLFGYFGEHEQLSKFGNWFSGIEVWFKTAR